MDTMMTRENLQEKFLAQATEHGQAVMIGDHKKANKIHKKLHGIYDQAKAQNQADVFEAFLNDANDSVRLWAAIFTLKFSPEKGENALQQLSTLSNIFALTAKTTLKLWGEGKLNLYGCFIFLSHQHHIPLLTNHPAGVIHALHHIHVILRRCLPTTNPAIPSSTNLTGTENHLSPTVINSEEV
jgi:hypothetical protein